MGLETPYLNRISSSLFWELHWNPNKKMKDELKRIREEAGLTHAEVAEKMGGSFNAKAIEAMENGSRNLGISSVIAFAHACGYEFTFKFIIKPQMKKTKLELINISQEVYANWHTTSNLAMKVILKRHPNLSPSDVPDEEFWYHPDGDGEIRVAIKGDLITMNVPKGHWSFLNQN